MVKNTILTENNNIHQIYKPGKAKNKQNSSTEDFKQDTIRFDVQKTVHSYNTRKRLSSIKEQSPIKSKRLYRKETENSVTITSLEESVQKCENIYEKETEVSEPIFSSLEEEVRRIQAELNRNLPEILPGRESQIEELHNVLLDCTKNKKSVSVYISGCPGSGKTITLKSLLNRPDISQKFKIVFINCMGMSKGNYVYKEIFKTLETTSSVKADKIDSVERIEYIIRKTQKPALIVLDEMDVLDTKNPSILYSLFELTSKLPRGKLALIGIGNTLNFIEKSLPFLRFKLAVEPVTFQFPSYDQQQIAEIIFQRIKNVNTKKILFSESAVKLLAAKVASVGGDARAALGIASTSVYHILEKVEEGFTDQVYTVSPQTIVTVMSSVYDTAEQFQNTQQPGQMDSLSLHQKLILCSLLLILKKNLCEPKDLNIQRIREMYRKICQQRHIDVINQTDFVTAYSLIEMYGIISLPKRKKLVDKVILKWDQNEMMTTLCKETLFGDILRND